MGLITSLCIFERVLARLSRESMRTRLQLVWGIWFKIFIDFCIVIDKLSADIKLMTELLFKTIFSLFINNDFDTKFCHSGTTAVCSKTKSVQRSDLVVYAH